MIIKIATCLLFFAVFTACESTSTADRQTLEERMMAKYASADTTTTESGEPLPPAEGPEDIPAEGPTDPVRNPALLPSPMLRWSAAAGL